MAKYETDVHLPSVPGVQKPGADRYAVPGKVAEQVKGKLPEGTAVDASWVDGEKLSVTIEHGNGQADQGAHAARAALQDVIGPNAVVPAFRPVAEDGGAA